MTTEEVIGTSTGYVYSHTQEHIDKDKDKSNTEFINIVFPIIKEHIGAKEYISIENDSNPILTLIDRHSGIDGLIRLSNGGLIPVATRIVNPDKHGNPYNSFTIRYTKNNGSITEWDKMISNRNNDTLRPKLTIQVCKGSNNKLNIGIISTDILIKFVEDRGVYEIRHGDNSSFLSIDWKDIMYKEWAKELTIIYN